MDFSFQLETEFLTGDDQLLLAVLIPVMVGDLSTEPDMKHTLLNIDNAAILLPQRTQTELRQLFDLLGSAVGRLLLAGLWLNWQRSDAKKVSQFLHDWRESQLELLQRAYIGLRQIIIGSVYSEVSQWSAIGYPGAPYH